MRIPGTGLEIRRQGRLHRKAAVSATTFDVAASRSVGWFPIFSNLHEAVRGAFQRNLTIDQGQVLTSGVVFACMTLIASDIAKLWLDLVEEDADFITTPVRATAFSPVLRKPNHFQNRIQFFMNWILAKLTHGNTYALKGRDGRGVVTRMYVLDSTRVTPLVAADGSVFYQLSTDELAGLTETSQLIVPAREIIHDLMYPLFHPLVGIGPLLAAGLSAMQSLKIQNQSAKLFQNNLMISGVLTAPGTISDQTAKRLEEYWNTNYAGEQNAGKIAALGDGLKFEPIMTRAIDAQLIEQLRWTGENICACFHVPPYKVAVGPAPTYNNIQSLNVEYYANCLQILIESLELCLDEGLELPAPYHAEFDLDALLRMDTLTAVDVATKEVTGGIAKPNEARAKMNRKPVVGGDTPYLQQQNYSLAALDRRDKAEPAPASTTAAPPTDPTTKALTAVLSELLRSKDVAVEESGDQTARAIAAFDEELDDAA
jgi:HK97 family phage portal protein